MQKKVGVILGKFYPLHQGHLNMIFEAKLEVDRLHVVVCSETERDQKLLHNSRFTLAVTAKDRIYWAKSILSKIPGIDVHHLNEDGIPSYPNGWEAWTERVLELFKEIKISPTHIFSSEPQDKAHYERLFKLPVRLMDPPRKDFPISATAIRNEPYKNWAFIPDIVRPYFTYTVAISDSSPALLPLKSLFEATSSKSKMVEILPLSSCTTQSNKTADLYLITEDDLAQFQSPPSSCHIVEAKISPIEQYQRARELIFSALQ